MSDTQGVTGSQAGQSGSGSQAGQSSAGQGDGQQGQGSQAGQTQEPYFNETFMHEGETVEQAFTRMQGALETARKQAAGYRQRLQGDSSGSQAGQSGNQGGQGNTQGQQGNSGQGQQGTDTEARIAALERALQTERQSNAESRTRTQLIEALSNEGAVNAARAVRLIDLDTLDIGDDGTVTDPLGAVRALKADMPQIFQDTRGGGDGGSGNTSGAGQSFNDLIRARASGQR